MRSICIECGLSVPVLSRPPFAIRGRRRRLCLFADTTPCLCLRGTMTDDDGDDNFFLAHHPLPPSMHMQPPFFTFLEAFGIQIVLSLSFEVRDHFLLRFIAPSSQKRTSDDSCMIFVFGGREGSTFFFRPSNITTSATPFFSTYHDDDDDDHPRRTSTFA